MPTDLERVRDFWEQAACGEALFLRGQTREDYLRQSQIRYQLEPYILPFAQFERWRGQDVLEIGVGLGADHQRFAEAGARLTGIDLTARAIELVDARFRVMGLPANLHIANAEALPFADHSFDLVYSWGVLHHSPDTPQTLREVYRVLRPGGRAKIMVYHKHSFVGYMLWLRYGLLRLRPLTPLARIYSRYLESPGTKAYTVPEALALFAPFTAVDVRTQLTHGDLLTSQAGQRHQGWLLRLARQVWPRWFIRRVFPARGLFMMIDAVKPALPAVAAPAAAPQPGTERLPVAVVMLTLNEEHNLRRVLENVKPWAQKIYIVDSLSTDRTVDIALEMGATVVQRAFTNFGDQWNWALSHLDIQAPWTLKLDPDERLPAALVEEMRRVLAGGARAQAYLLCRRLWFMGRPLRQTQWVLRLWRTGRARFSNVLVNEHPVADGAIGRLRCPLDHLDSPDLHHWFTKQNFYSTLQAIEQAKRVDYGIKPRFFGNALERRTFLKQVFWRLPLRHAIMWLYLGILRGGVLDGRVGLAWVRLRVDVQRWVDVKRLEIENHQVIPTLPQAPHGDFDPRVVKSEAHIRAHARQTPCAPE